MKVLLDTHAFLWALTEPDKLSSVAREVLTNDATEIMVSAASAWEIATKFRIGKLSGAGKIVADYTGAIQGLQAKSLAVTSEHTLKAGLWDVAHRDPFDRLLAAQSALEMLALVSGDRTMDQFGIEVIW